MKACTKKIVTFAHSLLLIQLLSTRSPILPIFKQERKYLRAVYVTLGTYFLYTNLLIRSFILVKSNTFRLTKFSKKRIAFNIFIPIPVQEMIYVKPIQKITPMDVSVSGTIDRKTYLKKFRGGFRHLAPRWIRLCKLFWARSKSEFGEHFAIQGPNSVFSPEENNNCLDDLWQ